MVLDAGAFLAVERDDRSMIARLAAAHFHGIDLRSNAIVIGQVWRDGRRQVRISRLLHGVDVVPVDESLGRAAGELLARAGTADVIDATVVLLASAGDEIVTSDPTDLRKLAEVGRRSVTIVPC